MMSLALSLILNFANATSHCEGEGSLFYEGQCYEQISQAECSMDPSSVVLNNACYKLESQNRCNSDFSLSVNEDVCIDTSSFSNPNTVFHAKSNYRIKIQLVPKNISFEFQKNLQPNGYLDRIFETHNYNDLFNTDEKQKYQYSMSTPLSINPSDFRLYDEHIAPNIFSTVQSSLEEQQSLRFKIDESGTSELIKDSKINIAKALESVLSKYGQDMQNYNIYIGVTQVDENSKQSTSFAGVGLPLNNGQFEIKVFSKEQPKDNFEQSNTLESETGVELSLLNIHSGSVMLDFYGNIHQMEQNLIDDNLTSNKDLKTAKGWAVGTRLKPSENLDLSVEVGESKLDDKQDEAFNEPIQQDEDLQLKLSISYVFPN